MGHRALDPRLPRDAAGSRRIDLLPHARHRGQVCRAGFTDVVDQPRGIALPIDQRSAEVQREHLNDPGEHVRERQEHEELDRGIGTAEVKTLLERVGCRDEVAVGEDAALRRSGRARRVHQRGDALGPDRGDARVDFVRWDVDATRDQLGDAERAQPPPLQQDDVLQSRTAATNLLDLGHLLGVLAEHHLGVGVTKHVLALLGRVGLIDRRHDGSRAEARRVGDGPFRTRIGQDRDAIPRLDPNADQPPGQVTRRLNELAIGDRLPAGIGLEAQRDAVALARAQDHLAQSLRTGGQLERRTASLGCRGLGDRGRGEGGSGLRHTVGELGAHGPLLVDTAAGVLTQRSRRDCSASNRRARKASTLTKVRASAEALKGAAGIYESAWIRPEAPELGRGRSCDIGGCRER